MRRCPVKRIVAHAPKSLPAVPPRLPAATRGLACRHPPTAVATRRNCSMEAMPINYKSELVGVLGQPVAENPTGVMQEAAFAACGLNWRYLTIEVPPALLADAITGVRAMGMQG